jgi:hypothetical protein
VLFIRNALSDNREEIPVSAVAGSTIQRLRKGIVIVGFAVSLAWTAWTWSGGFSKLLHVLLGLGVVGAILVFFDFLWIVGFALQLAGAGWALKPGHTPASWLRAIGRIRAAKNESLNNVVSAPLVRFGFYLNAGAAIAFAVVAPVAVLIGLPSTLWLGLLTFLASDTAMTLMRIVPQKRVMDARTGKVRVRTARMEDLDAYLVAQRASWGEKMAADREKLCKRFEQNPGGIFIAERFGRVVGAVTTIRIRHCVAEANLSWRTVTNDGTCSTHDPEGEVMCGVDMSATQDAPAGIHDDLLIRCMHQIISMGLEGGRLGGRLPGYHRFAAEMTAEKYLWKRRDSDGKFLDAQVRMYDAFPLVKVVGLLPDYFEDPESLNNGVLLTWRNPFYRLPGRRLWALLMVSAVRLETSVSRLRKQFYAHQKGTLFGKQFRKSKGRS